MVSPAAFLKGILLILPSLVAATGQLGFSLGVKHNPDGNCKFTDDFKKDLDVISGTSKLIRIYAVSDCNTMEQLMPAVVDKGFKIILGVWPNDDAHFELEKAALKKYIPLYGTDHIYAVTVGSEALYRKEFTGAGLADKINEVRTLLKTLGAGAIPVGTADSWNKLIEGDANDAIVASDIILANAFSYWQGQKQDNATHSFFDDIMQALDHVQKIRGGKPIDFWVGETNWPTGGQNFEDAVPSVANAATYWKESICAMIGWGVNVFVFEAFDEVYKPVEKNNDVEHHWGVWDQNYKPKYDLSC